jgi:hypothetical protein
MREIKFRVWDKVHKTFDVPGALINAQTGQVSATNPKDFDVQQFTGYKDKNGTMIFEGDICEWHGQGNLIYSNRFKITWDHRRGAWSLGACLNPIDMPSVEVVGNIHEQPSEARRAREEKNGI